MFDPSEFKSIDECEDFFDFEIENDFVEVSYNNHSSFWNDLSDINDNDVPW
jgi:hypothetical protein